MKSDFSIKPAGAPVAAPFVEHASAAADDAVATQLPSHEAVTAADAGACLRNDPQGQGDTPPHAVIDRAANAVVYRVVDNRTSLVVRQFPEAAALRRRAYFHALDLIKDYRPRTRVTDLRA